MREFVRIVADLDASYFVFENVKGLALGPHRRFLHEIIEAFSDVGYSVRAPWRVLNAASFGVPQDRERLILLGGKKGLRLPEYPKPLYRPAGSGIDFELPEGPSCLDALGDLPEADTFAELETSDAIRTENWGPCSGYASELRCSLPQDWHFGYRRSWEPAILTSSTRTKHTEISRRRFQETAPGCVEPISRFFKLPPDRVSNTLRAGTDAARGAFTSPRPIHYSRPRCITVREMARLHGFPDWFRFHRTKWHGARQIGNAVPLPLARIVANAVVQALGKEPLRPNRTVELGDPRLLRMDMVQAAAYWRIPVPVGRRDRKSGAKKRKQSEIEAERLAAADGAAAAKRQTKPKRKAPERTPAHV